MGAQHSRLQRRRRPSRKARQQTSFTKINQSSPDIVQDQTQNSTFRPKWLASVAALHRPPTTAVGIDRETAEALVEETLKLTMDLQRVHQQLNAVRKEQKSDAVGLGSRSTCKALLPMFSFEDRALQNRRSTLYPASSTQRIQEESPPATNNVNKATTSSEQGRASSQYSQEDVACSSPTKGLSPMISDLRPAAAERTPEPRIPPTPPLAPLRGSRQSSISTTSSSATSRRESTITGRSRHDSILEPAIKLCDELLNQSIESLASANQVKKGLRKARRGELPINPIGKPDCVGSERGATWKGEDQVL